MRLRAYMVWAGGPGEGAALVFASSVRQARLLALPVLRGWFDARWPDVRAKWLRDDAALVAQNADPAKYAAGIAHLIDSPVSCDSCGQWGARAVVAGLCARCRAGAERAA